MTTTWRHGDTAPLLRLIASLGTATAIILAVVLILSLVPERAATDTASDTDLAAAAVEIVAARTEARPTPPQPKWIWSSATARDDQTAIVRRVLALDAPAERITLLVSCDNRGTVLVDGDIIGTTADWTTPVEFDLTAHIRTSRPVIEIRAVNDGGPAGIIGVIEVTPSGRPTYIVATDGRWQASESLDFSAPRAAVELAPHGASPWGSLPGFDAQPPDRQLSVSEGFVVELVYDVPRRQGSWVSLAVDDAGRLIASDQAAGLFRITPGRIGADARDTLIEPIDAPVGAAQGLLCIENDLYCIVAGARAEGPGLYRLRDTNDDDSYDDCRLLRPLDDGGEHGPHGIVLGPDGMLYIVAGNHTALPDPERSLVPRHWATDALLPPLMDPNGHAVGIPAPGGWICRTDRDGETWELVAVGFRNVYDIAFNRDGELFAYDADMEWDMGAPWYRPTRINHVVSGADFGWRSGTAKWPADAPDSLPAIVDIGPGSPTGLCFGDGTSFPERERQAMYALDWTFGTIYAVHLTPDGASYRAAYEPFITGRPLPVADIVANPHDGALYFVVGGRGTRSAVYRVRSNTGARSAGATSATVSAARALRHRLEALHQADPSVSIVTEIWPHLGHSDRFIAHAARIALEHQPPELWSARGLAEQDPPTRLAAMLALARGADATVQPAMIDALSAMAWDDLSSAERHSWLRAWQLCFIRFGLPDENSAHRVVALLEPIFPTSDAALNRALCDLLVALRSPSIVARTIPLMERLDDQAAPSIDPDLLSRNDTYGSVIMKMATNAPQRQAVHYALALSGAERGWTTVLHERYFNWFETARRARGGLSYAGFLDQIRARALARIPESSRARYAAIGSDVEPDDDRPVPHGPGRTWTVDELTGLAAEGLRNRDHANGRRMYAAAMCAECHRFAGTGRPGGPDLTAVATRYTIRELAESIIEPSRTISDQYALTEFQLDDDSVVLGRVLRRDERMIHVMPSLLVPDLVVEIATDRVAREQPSAVSAMMPGLLDRLNADEVLDLVAYLMAEGDARDPMFGRSRRSPAE